jgi:drug/metabolite transporter (DMT)-like permease
VFWLGLGLALISAIAVNWAYALEHDAAAQLPPLTFARPVESARLLLGAAAWLRAFALESAGWALYVVALRISALSLVQAVSAAGIAVLALVGARGKIRMIPRQQQAAVLVAMVGLLLLGLSLRSAHQIDSVPSLVGVVIWFAACAAAALVALRGLPSWVPAARFGLAGGLFFAVGDMSAKLVGYGGTWLLAALPLIAGYALGTSLLQGGYQRGGALTTAGIATLTTNAVPIVAGFVLFDERLPHGASGGLQLAAFCSIVVSATLLGRRSL